MIRQLIEVPNWTPDSKGSDLGLQSKGTEVGSWNSSWKLTLAPRREHREWLDPSLLKPSSLHLVTYLQMRPHLQILPKQLHQLGTKYSNTWIYGSYFHSKHKQQRGRNKQLFLGPEPPHRLNKVNRSINPLTWSPACTIHCTSRPGQWPCPRPRRTPHRCILGGPPTVAGTLPRMPGIGSMAVSFE